MEAFVYCWTDHKTNMLYIGSHKGTIDDGYICSSELMLEEYNKRPNDFTRQIIAHGNYPQMHHFEGVILTSVDARNNSDYYNLHNGNGKFFLSKHTEKSKAKMRAYKRTAEHCRKISEAKIGKSIDLSNRRSYAREGNPRFGIIGTEESKINMSRAQSTPFYADGKYFLSLYEAELELGIKKTVIRNKLESKSNKHLNWYYENKPKYYTEKPKVKRPDLALFNKLRAKKDI